MKTIKMQVSRCGAKGWNQDGEKEFVRVSRWITVKEDYNPTKRNSLWDYVEDENGYHPYNSNFDPTNGTYLNYFVWQGRKYAVEQFLALGNPFYCPVSYSYEDENGRLCYLSGVDGDNYYNPIYVEFSECCEQVRIYQEV